ncbi:hypothetical protein ARMGADRAFT_1011519, partial [Armillaria gallica]
MPDLYSQSRPKAQPAHDGALTVKTRLNFDTTYRRSASKHWTMATTNIRTSASSSALNQSRHFWNWRDVIYEI